MDDQIAKEDQIKAACTEAAGFLAHYFRELRATGFSRKEALRLVIEQQRMLGNGSEES